MNDNTFIVAILSIIFLWFVLITGDPDLLDAIISRVSATPITPQP